VTLEIQKSSYAQMIADWRWSRIDIDLPVDPALGMWLFSVYFGLAHEVGHLLWHAGPLTLREAWASYFALNVLESADIQQMSIGHTDRILLAKDYWLSRGVLMFQRHGGNVIEQAIANIVRVWRRAGNKRVSEFLPLAAKTLEAEKLVLTTLFSRHFGVSEATCAAWLLEI
jgi:hypothetical protein